jgi:aminoglycoside phosphotransferase (APT) family kinase protein
MRTAEARRAVAAALAVAASLGLTADEAVVLQDSNKLTLRLLPCDVLARVAPETEQVAHFEVGLARRLAAAACPVALLDPRAEPRVHVRDGFEITLWTYHAPAPHEVAPAAYADALARLHAGMRTLDDVPVPHFTDRVKEARQLLTDRDRTPALAEADRELLDRTLRGLGRTIDEQGGPGQLLHGEPHPGNVLATPHGPLFIDLETCCHGPVEFDLAHAPKEAEAHYPGADPALVRQCRTLVLAMITTWRWDRNDRFPDGQRLGREWLGQLRTSLGHAAQSQL